MNKSKLIIPANIHVGYQNRKDTYTGKLAYIIYTDAKGKKRKEGSWNSWCSREIEKHDFTNEPTSGFVLNKKVGDYRYSSWEQRRAHVRVYDPRNFEFEISVDNLLFILEECSAIKGKGLEGEFVYAWDGQNLVLLPTTSQDYVDSQKFTNLQTQKVTKKDMKEGCMYLDKDFKEVMYLGRHEVWDVLPWSYSKDNIYKTSSTKKHVFMYKGDNNKHYIQYKSNSCYDFHTGFTKLAQKLTDDPHPDFANEYDKFITRHGEQEFVKLKENRVFPKDNSLGFKTNEHIFLKRNDKFYRFRVSEFRNAWDYYYRSSGKTYSEEFMRDNLRLELNCNPLAISKHKIVHASLPYNNLSIETITKFDFYNTLEFYELEVETSNGLRMNVRG